MKFLRCAAIAAAMVPSVVEAAGYARNENFIVYTPEGSNRAEDDRFASLVLKRAEEYRSEVATKWLGGELPPGAGRAVIYVDLSNNEDRGLTWAKDKPDRQFHNIWVTTSPRLAAGETLHHEIAHAVFATKYPHPNRLPSWLDEGIACQYDEATRHDLREQVLRSCVRTGRTISLARLLESPDLRSFDEDSYAAAASLVSFLLTRGDEQTLVRFALDGQQGGWEAALQSHYGMSSVEQLQTQWQAWLVDSFRAG